MANDKIICKCYKVTEKDIKKAIKNIKIIPKIPKNLSIKPQLLSTRLIIQKRSIKYTPFV